MEHAVKNDISVLALTDINNTSCAVEFYDLCLSAGIKPVLGIEYRSVEKRLYIGLARNQRGWTFLNQLLSSHLCGHEALPPRAPDLPDTYFVYPDWPFADMPRANEYLGIRPGQRQCPTPFASMPSRQVLWQPATFINTRGHQTHRLLRAIARSTLLSKVGPTDLACPTDWYWPPHALHWQTSSLPHLSRNARHLLDTCEPDYFQSREPNLESFTRSEAGDYALLQCLAKQGMLKRYRDIPVEAPNRLADELNIIARLDLATYFLVAWDVVRYAKARGFRHVGRGSGANSLVAYALGITDVDPLEMNLYFERFINVHRKVAPDFDLDFNWTDRDEMLSYLFRHYGPHRVAMLATYQTFKGRSIVREVGKILGLPKFDIDQIISEPNARHKHHPLSDKVFEMGALIQKFPRHLSVHAGGVIISETTLCQSGSTQMMPKGFCISQFDMVHAEQMGFHKFDILSQRGIGHIHDTVNLIKINRGVDVSVQQMDAVANDPKAIRQLQSGDVIGCFYIESPAMRGLLSKLTCRHYNDLVAATSIIRPGVAKSGMMQAYIDRHRGKPFADLHPVMSELLASTYGIMIYQEDVMQVVHRLAGFDLGQSDQLRRLMTGKNKSASILQRLKEQFQRQCLERGHDLSFVREIWRQISSFSGYAFCKAHSATYAAESMQSLYLKARFPLEFLVAVINNGGGFYDTEVYVHALRVAGGRIHPPCINSSAYQTRIHQNDIYLGFNLLKYLRKDTIELIATVRSRFGPFKSLHDVTTKLRLPLQQLLILARVGALRFTGQEPAKLMRIALETAAKQIATPSLFGPFESSGDLKFDPPLEENAQAFVELEILGFPVSQSPFEMLASPLPDPLVLASDMRNHVGKLVRMVGYFVVEKPVTTVRGRHMSFAAWWDQLGDFFDTVHFPPSLSGSPNFHRGVYLLEGRIVVDNGFPMLEVGRQQRLSTRLLDSNVDWMWKKDQHRSFV